MAQTSIEPNANGLTDNALYLYEFMYVESIQ